jgi:hypothetical protein
VDSQNHAILRTTNTGADLIIQTDNQSEKMRILDNGNVGVGITAPLAQLHISGQIRIDGGSPAIHKVLQSDVNGLGSWEFPAAKRVHTQTAHGITLPTHGFVAVRMNGSNVVAANTAAEANLPVKYVIGVPDSNTLVLFDSGYITVASHGLTVGSMYFLNDSGGISTTADTDYSVAVATVISSDTILLHDPLPIAAVVSTKTIYNDNGTVGAGRTVALTDTLNFDSNTLVLDGTNNRVGMGIAAPLNTLHLVGSLRFVDGNQAAGKILTSDANGVATWQEANGAWVSDGTFSSKVSGTTTNPTFGTLAIDQIYTRKVGKVLHVMGVINQTTAGTAGSGVYEIDFSSWGGGVTGDTTVAPATSGNYIGAVVGNAVLDQTTAGAGFGNAGVLMVSSSKLRIEALSATGQTSIQGWSSTWFALSAGQIRIMFKADIPIT